MTTPSNTIEELVGRVEAATGPDREPFSEDFTTLNWRYADHWSGESASFSVAGFTAYVKDYDGDSSGWVLKHRGERIAEGESWEHSPPHFFICLQQAEAALRSAVKSRIATLRSLRIKGDHNDEA